MNMYITVFYTFSLWQGAMDSVPVLEESGYRPGDVCSP